MSYADIPHFRASTAPGHEGRFVFGMLRGKRVAVMQGRMHCYEGYTMAEAAYAVRVVRLLGAKTLFVTNAAGGVDASYGIGDLMIIEDQVNLLGMDPCIGPDQPDLRPRFFDMTNAYDPELRASADAAARELGISVQHGVYAAEPGPSFETPAEIRAYRAMGIDAIGMSTVLEVIAARSCAMRVLGISLISNPAAGVCDEPLQMDDVAKAAAAAADKIEALVVKVIGTL